MEKNNPRSAARPTPSATGASIDTVELFVRRPPRGLAKTLRQLFGRRIEVKEVRDRTNRFHGVRVPVNRSSRADIEVMSRMLRDRRLGACVSRVDVAVDFTTEDREAADALVDWLDKHVVLKWRSRKRKKRRWSEDARYQEGDPEWIIWAGEHASRDIAVYHKTDTTVRMELRFQKPDAVRRAGLNRLDELQNLDTRGIINHNVKAQQMTERHIKKVTRQTFQEDLKKNRSKKIRSHPVTDRYRARIPYRVVAILSRSDAQAINGPGMDTVRTDQLSIPNQIEWGGLKYKGKSNRVGDGGALLRVTR